MTIRASSARFDFFSKQMDSRSRPSGADASKGADCFVIDYKMPNIDGIDLASRLRSRDIAGPIILITGYPDDRIPAKAAVVGVHHVLLKPHIEESLVACIRGAIQEASPVTGLTASDGLR